MHGRRARLDAFRAAACSLAAIAVAGCGTIGLQTSAVQDHDYGAPATMRVCILKPDAIADQRMDEMIAAVNREFEPYRITLEVAWVRPWTRPGFTHTTIFGDVARRDLEAPCDRLVALVDRHGGDFVWGLLMPEILGEVDVPTGTRGFVVAEFGSLNQIGAGPTSVVVHEFYHLVGCPHESTRTKCYGRIAKLKAAIAPDADFFPGMNIADGTIVASRATANELVKKMLDEQASKKAKPGRPSRDEAAVAP